MKEGASGLTFEELRKMAMCSHLGMKRDGVSGHERAGTSVCSPDPNNHLCSLTGKYISEKYFTYRSVQIFEILLEAFYSPESDTRHKIMQDWFDYSTQLAL